ncbi:MAG: molybdate ABC transporter substrate-binding protein [Abitibacteriaceae bacterium]|nr:molybdate ABC transporter substrate-binding protein [Abditibacteriaceae bacterium]
MRCRYGILLCLAILILCPFPARADELLVSAASSLTDAFNEIGSAFTKAHPQTTVRFNFAASGPLQQQIEQGAPVDVFASASAKEMDALQKANRLEPKTRLNFVGNRLVLIAPRGSKLKGWNDLKAATVRRIAISNPDSVPSGRYAKETLTRHGLWPLVQPKTVFGENVRQTLAYVANGDVDAGLVFATDARIASQKVRVVQTAVPGKDHQPILYPAAVIAGAPHAVAARQFMAFLQGSTAQHILLRYGFATTRLLASPSAQHTPIQTKLHGWPRQSQVHR